MQLTLWKPLVMEDLATCKTICFIFGILIGRKLFILLRSAALQHFLSFPSTEYFSVWQTLEILKDRSESDCYIAMGGRGKLYVSKNKLHKEVYSADWGEICVYDRNHIPLQFERLCSYFIISFVEWSWVFCPWVLYIALACSPAGVWSFHFWFATLFIYESQ